ncbi:ACR241Cp [Eremothecium gossypii ATCC 10895]|uniref:Oleate activated transcription factor 3 n=1 Tax=Eremothecium gossypii (strain ATCC 10895 / CBS 109.51 / FGSC 9923 / NRRL Y-1056) TaxID=284811 RepID=OAF3_EREGS|nr:ACR241Cp [Eremothecium gossypii ATCC 10895]Q75BN0.2 RecName: Full=Oleate activated transcription factor 3 [Eremothecium gossypii ATCC 10895]AAS51467.2 ACR241Cp [Eremothecium gossypii ATCC 10895]AEY95758.1 FACR241Cp [Eremothecium gossypii FDAG1]
MMPLKKRQRQTLVCSNCKRRKSRCDRGKPACGNCIRLGNRETCHYFISPSEKGGDGGDSPGESAGSNGALERWQFVRAHSCGRVDLTAGRTVVFGKRSAVYVAGVLSTDAVRYRDLYLELLSVFSHAAIKKTVSQLHAQAQVGAQEASLPNSVKRVIRMEDEGMLQESSPYILAKHKKVHQSLVDGFAQSRYEGRQQFADVEEAAKQHLVERYIFLQKVLPAFKKHVLPLIPIYDERMLCVTVEQLYDDYQKRGKFSAKNGDLITVATILLITRLVYLAIRFDKCSVVNVKYNRILELDTEPYAALAYELLPRDKLLRKVTLPQLQCLILLRFHNWCSPMDGDGESLQYSNVLMGTIYACCKEIGASWLSFKEPDKYDFAKARGSNSRFTMAFAEMEPGEVDSANESVVKLYQQIWAVVLHWDRNVSMLTGLEPIIGTSMKPAAMSSYNNWYADMISLDYLKWQLLTRINEDPSEVNLEEVKPIISEIRQRLGQFTSESELAFEQELILQLVELSILHAAFIGPTSNVSAAEHRKNYQELLERIIHLSGIFITYFHDPPTTNHQYGRFYTNKIVEVAMYRVYQILTGLILRISSACQDQSLKPTLMKFYKNLCSLYFNELGYDYYQVFKRLFEAKVKYKILEQTANPVFIMLRYLFAEIQSGNMESMKSQELIGLIYGEYKKMGGELNLDMMDLWNHIVPTQCDHNIGLNSLFTTEIFPTDQYSDYNLFVSFYDYASNKLTEDTNQAAEKSIAHNPSTSIHDLCKGGASPHFDLLEGILDPLDFMTYLDSIPGET